MVVLQQLVREVVQGRIEVPYGPRGEGGKNTVRPHVHIGDPEMTRCDMLDRDIAQVVDGVDRGVVAQHDVEGNSLGKS